ncbi:hypothetical protein [Melittangium boletus]|uniref:hypothetical protein n=1 Tax=Melittangium boletus TaxID=83453 RepID=UPI0012FDE2F9|nr:hypothetical protein [Melittangium boletus]
MRKRFWQQVATAFDKLNIALLQEEGLSFAKGEREYLALQRKLLRQVELEWESLQIKRLIARSILLFAYTTGCSWTEMGRALRRSSRLGYLNASDQAAAAHFVLLWASDNDHSKATLGWKMLEAAERRLLRLRRNHMTRKQELAAGVAVRKRVARKGLLPPASVSSPKETSRRRA